MRLSFSSDDPPTDVPVILVPHSASRPLYAAACFAVLQLARAATPSNCATPSPPRTGPSSRRHGCMACASMRPLPPCSSACRSSCWRCHVPARWHRAWQWTWHGVASCGVLVMVLASVADHYFLAEVQRHIGQEVTRDRRQRHRLPRGLCGRPCRLGPVAACAGRGLDRLGLRTGAARTGTRAPPWHRRSSCSWSPS